MRKTTLSKNLLATLMGFLFLCSSSAAYPQGSPSPQKSLSDKELGAFAKAYVEVQKIRSEYEPSLAKAKDAKENERIQQEANSKIKRALEQQGLAVESYNKIYSAVNGNEELRKKTLKLVEQERKRS